MPFDLEQQFREFVHAPQRPLFVHQWGVHGILVEWSTDDPAIDVLIREMMRGFPPADDTETTPPIRIGITSGTGWSIPHDAAILPPSTNEFVDTLAAYHLRTTFARKESVNYYEIAPLGGAIYEIGSGIALGYIPHAESYSAWQTTHLYLLIVFLEMLRGQGLFWIHAGTVADSGRATLFVGQTGQGKTTTVLSLVEAGFQFLSEDRTFIRALPEGLEVLAFPLDVAITANTLTMLSSLRARIDQVPTNQRKVRVDPSLLFPTAMIERAFPALILFPQVGNQRQTRVQRVETADALRRLLPNSLLASNPTVTEDHFMALTQLVRSVKSYEIILGTDLEQIPRTIRKLLLTRA